jgi:hypothetical protein
MNPKDAFGANTLVPMANNIGVRKTYAQVARVKTNYAPTAARNARIDFEPRSRDREIERSRDREIKRSRDREIERSRDREINRSIS